MGYNYKKRWLGFFILLLMLMVPVVTQGGWKDFLEKVRKDKEHRALFKKGNTKISSGSSLKILSVTPKGIIKKAHHMESIIVTFEEPMVELKALPEGLNVNYLDLTDCTAFEHWPENASVSLGRLSIRA